MSLKGVITKKIVISFILFIISVGISFTLIHLAPGDPIVYLLAGSTPEGIPREYIEEIRSKYGLDKPIWVQFISYLRNIFRGDLGQSFFHGKPVLTLILERLPNTLLLTGAGFLISLIPGTIIGIYCSKKPYNIFDNFFTLFSLVFWSLPYFWLGIMAILFFSITWGILPAQGMMDVGKEGINISIDILRHLILPASTLGLGNMALYLRFTRTSMLEELNKDYIKTAWAKGCNFNDVFYGHAFRNALLPLVTIVALRMRNLIMGSLLIETTFAWPGIGRLLYDSITVRDYGLIQALFVFYSLITILFSLIADIAYAFVDPRISTGG